MVCGDCRRVGCPTKRTLSIFSSNFLPHMSDLVAKMVARMISENLKGETRGEINPRAIRRLKIQCLCNKRHRKAYEVKPLTGEHTEEGLPDGINRAEHKNMARTTWG